MRFISAFCFLLWNETSSKKERTKEIKLNLMENFSEETRHQNKERLENNEECNRFSCVKDMQNKKFFFCFNLLNCPMRNFKFLFDKGVSHQKKRKR